MIDKPFAGGTWSKARYFGFIRSNLRRARWPVKYQVLTSRRRSYSGANKRQKFEYQCAICEDWRMQKNIQVDHIIPCGSLNCYEDLPGFVERLFCEAEGMRILCKECHKKVTNEEMKRKKNE